MKKLLLISIVAVICIVAWNQKCEHVFVAVEPLECKVEYTAGYSTGDYSPIVGKHKGKELVCVKCFEKVHQVVDYGTPMHQSFDPTNDANLTGIFGFQSVGNGKDKPDSLPDDVYRIHVKTLSGWWVDKKSKKSKKPKK